MVPDLATRLLLYPGPFDLGGVLAATGTFPQDRCVARSKNLRPNWMGRKVPGMDPP